MTGVSKFSKVSLFSGLNNLTDITLDAQFSALCGYTDADVDTVFAPELPGLDREEIRQWYNGYNWLGTSVYNPFDLLLLFRSREFRPYWFETGTPTFLIKLLEQRQQFTPDLGRIVAPEALLSTFDVDNISVEALLFQAGYLTIASAWRIPGRLELTLKYPNLEVQASLNDSLLQSLTGGLAVPGPQISQLYRLLQAQNLGALQDLFHAFTPPFPMTGTARMSWPILRVTTPAFSTATLPPWVWTFAWKTPPTRAALTWRCCLRGRCICSSSRW